MPCRSAIALTSVHPHVCGEKQSQAGMLMVMVGSSPRVWGKAFERLAKRLARRFIPTCVGKRRSLLSSFKDSTVHPHVCGEKISPLALLQEPFGSSPRVWGKATLGMEVGSVEMVHPHVCGEKGRGGVIERDGALVHPHVCGEKISKLVLFNHSVRFIPTCVGKRKLARTSATMTRVHPHVCGEKFVVCHGWQWLIGSSPRVWGKGIVCCVM